MVHMYSGILAMKRMKYCHLQQIDGSRDYHTKWSKSDKDKYYMISLICGI